MDVWTKVKWGTRDVGGLDEPCINLPSRLFELRYRTCQRCQHHQVFYKYLCQYLSRDIWSAERLKSWSLNGFRHQNWSREIPSGLQRALSKKRTSLIWSNRVAKASVESQRWNVYRDSYTWMLEVPTNQTKIPTKTFRSSRRTARGLKNAQQNQYLQPPYINIHNIVQAHFCTRSEHDSDDPSRFGSIAQPWEKVLLIKTI